ncbi:neuropeptide-like protein C4orf48 homolog isoform X2 [Sapajus apella]|uniref:Neuropeptide-like protein C4orf48 homolog isoform X2 n=1 Tax=Sapajus apella TaxID=9515 RepID=A0A6J3FWV0_SAPAP|nr:neuropeptide-like protein C4orf48 homolog isoform X2 [Sapajus apella]
MRAGRGTSPRVARAAGPGVPVPRAAPFPPPAMAPPPACRSPMSPPPLLLLLLSLALLGARVGAEPAGSAVPAQSRPPMRGLPRLRVHAARPAGPAEDSLQPGRPGGQRGPGTEEKLRPGKRM